MTKDAAAAKSAAGRLLSQHPFRPAWWAPSGLTQTVAASFGHTRGLTLKLERLDTPDGDFVRLHRKAPAPLQPTVLLLHGLEGSLQSGYVGAFARDLPAGWGLAVLEFRSCGGETNRLARSYHSGETADLAHVVQRLMTAEPGIKLFVIGFSLGGNVLLKWLGECGDRAPAELAAAAAVSVPYDLAACAQQCDQRWRGLMARHFLRTLVPKALDKARRFPELLDVSAVRSCRTFAQFDDLVTARLHGFESAAHYWQEASCTPWLSEIRRPTLLINSKDDPLVPQQALPRMAVSTSPYLVADWTARGGHAAFLTGSPWRPQRWAGAQALRFFQLHAGR